MGLVLAVLFANGLSAIDKSEKPSDFCVVDIPLYLQLSKRICWDQAHCSVQKAYVEDVIHIVDDPWQSNYQEVYLCYDFFIVHRQL